MKKPTVEEHLKSRYYRMDLHPCWVFEQDDSVVFPFWNLNGQMKAYQRYRPYGSKEKMNNPTQGKYYTFRNKNDVSFWGLESWNFSNTLFVTEGVFDACRLTNHGYSALALASNDPSKAMKSWFKMVRSFRPVVAVCDGDAAGRKLAKAGHRAEFLDEGKDLGDFTEKEVVSFLKGYK